MYTSLSCIRQYFLASCGVLQFLLVWSCRRTWWVQKTWTAV